MSYEVKVNLTPNFHPVEDVMCSKCKFNRHVFANSKPKVLCLDCLNDFADVEPPVENGDCSCIRCNSKRLVAGDKLDGLECPRCHDGKLSRERVVAMRLVAKIPNNDGDS